MIAVWLSFIIWIAFASVSGVIEAFYFSAVRRKKIKRFTNDHMAFTAIRGVAAVILLAVTFGFTWYFCIGGFLLMLGFSFWHNGFLYQAGKWLDGAYKKGFFDHTTTSDAKFNFDFKTRLFMFIISLIFLLL